MDKFEKLVKSIMAECEKENEPVTREEAEEMAKMEIGEKSMKRYEQTINEKKQRKPKERKVDEDKKFLFDNIHSLFSGLPLEIINQKNEAELTFNFKNNLYTLKLVKHRPPKN